jgi:hypothetical protein
MGVGINVARHYDLTRNIDNVVSLFWSYVFGYRRYLAKPYSKIKLAIDPVGEVNYMTVFQYRVESLQSYQ